jgi:hypothetical protein
MIMAGSVSLDAVSITRVDTVFEYMTFICLYGGYIRASAATVTRGDQAA